MAVVCKLTRVSSLAMLPPDTAHQLLGEAGESGDLDFEQFTTWYHSRAFLPIMILTDSQREVRDIAMKLGLTISQLENYKIIFDRFDSNHSGRIEFSEFKELLPSLLKISKAQEIPENRVLRLW